MNIIILQGSPNRDGSTALLVEELGRVLGYACGTPSMTRATDAPQRAFELGCSLLMILASAVDRHRTHMHTAAREKRWRIKRIRTGQGDWS